MGKVKIVDDPTRGPVAEFDGESRLEVSGATRRTINDSLEVAPRSGLFLNGMLDPFSKALHYGIDHVTGIVVMTD